MAEAYLASVELTKHERPFKALKHIELRVRFVALYTDETRKAIQGIETSGAAFQFAKLVGGRNTKGHSRH